MPLFVVHTLCKSHIESITFKCIPSFRVVNALGSGERDLALQQGIMAPSNGKCGLTNYFHSVREDTSQPVVLTTRRRGVTDWMSGWIVNPFLWVKRNWFLATLSRGRCRQLVKTVVVSQEQSKYGFQIKWEMPFKMCRFPVFYTVASVCSGIHIGNVVTRFCGACFNPGFQTRVGLVNDAAGEKTRRTYFTC